MMFLEALAGGCVILYCDPYLKEGTHAGNAVLVEPSAEGFAEGLRYLIKNRAQISAMKKASKKEAKHFNYRSFAAKYNKVLDDLPKLTAAS
jgi:glycosyltransferase involved in cell wall biosynthesis